jgi:aconitate hydratase
MIAAFEKIGTKEFHDTCGPCMRQWDRAGADKQEKKQLYIRCISLNEHGNPIHMLLSLHRK